MCRRSYAGHLIPPKRIEFGRIQKNSPESGGGTRVAITGKSDEEKAGTSPHPASRCCDEVYSSALTAADS